MFVLRLSLLLLSLIVFIELIAAEPEIEVDETIYKTLRSYSEYMSTLSEWSVDYDYFAKKKGSGKTLKKFDMVYNALIAPNGSFLVSKRTGPHDVISSSCLDARLMSFDPSSRVGGIPNKKSDPIPSDVPEKNVDIIDRVPYITANRDNTAHYNPVCEALGFTTIYSRFIDPLPNAKTMYARYCDAFSHELLREVSKCFVISKQDEDSIELQLSKEFIGKFQLQYYRINLNRVSVGGMSVWRCEKITRSLYWNMPHVKAKISREILLKTGVESILFKYDRNDERLIARVIPCEIAYVVAGVKDPYQVSKLNKITEAYSGAVSEAVESLVIEMESVAEWGDFMIGPSP